MGGVSVTWGEKAANTGNNDAMNNLGNLLTELDPPDLASARTWYENAATAGNTDAMHNLGVLLKELDPPDLAGARAVLRLLTPREVFTKATQRQCCSDGLTPQRLSVLCLGSEFTLRRAPPRPNKVRFALRQLSQFS